MMAKGFPLSNHLQILIHRRSAQTAYPRQFADVHPARGVGRIVPEEYGGDVLFRRGAAPDLLALGFCVRHAGFDTGANHGKFQLAEYTRHLQKRFAHRVGLTVVTVDGNGADDLQAEALFADNVDDLAELLCGA